MSHEAANLRPTALLVGGERCDHTGVDGAARWFDSAQLRLCCSLEIVAEVYRALARIGRDEDRSVQFVLTCADKLTPAELEFFDLARRLRPDIWLGVCGSVRSRIDRCTSRGAMLIESADALRQWIASAPAHQDTSFSMTEVQEPASDWPANTPEASAVEASLVDKELASASPQHASVIVAPVESLDDDDAEMDAEDYNITDAHHVDGDDVHAPPQTVRVPWLRYDATPNRTAPQASRNTGERVRPNRDGENKPQRSYEPLLTDEELRALIGDDLESLGPERARPGDDRSKGQEESG